MKRIAVFLLIACLTLGLFACSVQEGKPMGSPDQSGDAAVSPSVQPTVSGEQTLSDEELNCVVLRIDGSDVTLSELRYQIASLMSAYEYYGEESVDWEQQIEGKSARDFFVDEAIDTCKLFRAVERYAEAGGYSVDVSDKIAEHIENSGGEESFTAQLTAAGMTRSLYEYLVYVPELYYNIYDALYGRAAPTR